LILLFYKELDMMRLRVRKWVGHWKKEDRRKYLYKLVIIGCLAATIPIVFAGWVYYTMSMERVRNTITEESQSALFSIRDRAELVLQRIEEESLQLANDPLVNELFFSMDKNDAHNEILVRKSLLDKVSILKNMNGAAKEIFLYDAEEQLVISNDYGVIPLADYRYRNEIEQWMADQYRAQWLSVPDRTGSGRDRFMHVRMLPVIGDQAAQGMLVYEMDVDMFHRLTDGFLLSDDQELFIIHYQHWTELDQDLRNWLFNRQDELQGIQMIRTAEHTSGQFSAQGIDGKSAQYFYFKNIYGRTYVSVVPEQLITQRLSWIREVTALVVFVFIGVGIALAFVASRLMYSPIDKLIQYSRSLRVGQVDGRARDELEYLRGCLQYLSHEANKLSSYIDRIQPTLREKFMRQVLSGDYGTRETLAQECGKFGIALKATNVVLVAETWNIYREKRFLPEEKGTVAFVLANVMQEILQNEALQGWVIPFHGKGVAWLQFAGDTPQEDLERLTERFARLVVDALTKYLGFDATVGIGRFYPHVADVPVSCQEAEQALQYRMFRETENVLFIDSLEQEKKRRRHRYPRELAEAIVQSLERGDSDTAGLRLRDFSGSIRKSQSFSFIYQSYHLLLASILDTLEKKGAPVWDLSEQNLFGQLRNIRSPEDVQAWFAVTVFPLYKSVAREASEPERDSVIAYVCQYIREHCESDLSLVHCAELVEMSPSHLSRLFKKETGKNFLEFVVECKMDLAKRLLRETDMRVGDIAAHIGYSERNLNRLFRRHVHMSPGNYRAKFRASLYSDLKARDI